MSMFLKKMLGCNSRTEMNTLLVSPLMYFGGAMRKVIHFPLVGEVIGGYQNQTQARV